MSHSIKNGIQRAADLLDLYAENFTPNGNAMRELAEHIDECQDVDAGITDFVDDAFYDDMETRHHDGDTFDTYIENVCFPYDDDIFAAHLRTLWDTYIEL